MMRIGDIDPERLLIRVELAKGSPRIATPCSPAAAGTAARLVATMPLARLAVSGARFPPAAQHAHAPAQSRLPLGADWAISSGVGLRCSIDKHQGFGSETNR
jgi:hypothetical protein